MPPNNIPARFSFLTLLLLAHVVLIGTAESNAPPANALTALQVWFVAITLFLVGPAAQFAALLVRRRATLRRVLVIYGKPGDGQNGANDGQNEDELDDPLKREDFWKVDRVYAGIFAALFAVFLLIYWLSYAV